LAVDLLPEGIVRRTFAQPPHRKGEGYFYARRRQGDNPLHVFEPYVSGVALGHVAKAIVLDLVNPPVVSLTNRGFEVEEDCQ